MIEFLQPRQTPESIIFIACNNISKKMSENPTIHASPRWLEINYSHQQKEKFYKSKISTRASISAPPVIPPPLPNQKTQNLGQDKKTQSTTDAQDPRRSIAVIILDTRQLKGQKQSTCKGTIAQFTETRHFPTAQLLRV